MQRKRDPIVSVKISHTAKQKGVFKFNRLFIQEMLKETDLEYNMRIYQAGCDFATYKYQQHSPKLPLLEIHRQVDDILINKAYWDFWVNAYKGFEQQFCDLSMCDESIDPIYFKLLHDTELSLFSNTRLMDCNFWNYIERSNYE